MEYTRKARKPSRGETIDCPFCGEEILATARKCKHCSEWLDKPEERQGSGALARGTADARAVTKGLKEKELQDTQRKVLTFFLMIAMFIAWVLAKDWWAPVLVLIAGSLLIGRWYYRE